MSTADLKSDLDALKADFAQIKDDLRGIAKDAIEQGKSKAYDARGAAKDKLEDSLDSLENYVKEKPLTAVSIAFAAGVLTSIYMRHR